MGNNICIPQQQLLQLQKEDKIQDVYEILSDLPQSQRNSMFRGTTNRYHDLNVINQDNNRYIFLLKIDGTQSRVVIPVINQLAHRALVDNYKLAVGRDMLIDPFDQRIQATLVPVRNQNTGLQYSMRIVPFRGYNGLAFKRALQEIWIYRTLQRKKHRMLQDPRSIFLWLQDFFIYGVDSDQQAVIFLYQKIQGSLTQIADYRFRSLQRWKTSQRLKILRDIVQGCCLLQEEQMIHRDIRASNIFFSPAQKKYLLGGFSCARTLGGKDDEDDLMTVNGIQTQTSGKLRQLIAGKQNMGIFKVRERVYYQLRVLNRLLDSRRVADQIGQSQFKLSIFINIQNMLNTQQPLQDILRTIESGLRVSDRSSEFNQELSIAPKLFKLYPLRHRQLCERYLFEAYSKLGYQIQFSEMAHKMIEKNNFDGHPFANAKILKSLGLFYQKHGTGGTQYLLNACVLFCKQVECEMEKGLFEDANIHMDQGQDTYIHLANNAGQFSMNMIELKRLRTELRARTLWEVSNYRQQDQKVQILQLMSKALELAADQNLPIEKQMKMFLTWGVVHRQCGDRVAAEQRFRNGLAVCQNEGSFESHQSAVLTKSHFLYQMSVMKLDMLQQQHDPLLPIDKQTYSPEDLPKLLQNWLLQALEIREKQSTRPYQTVQCYLALSKVYMLQSEYLQAKVQLKRALIRLTDLQKTQKIQYEAIVQVHYDLGSVNYKLQDYQESVDHYRQAIVMLQDRGGDEYWINVIAGNLGLSYLRAGLAERGKTLLEKSKEAIRAQHGAQHYDFLFLTAQELIINNTLPT